MTWFRVDDSFPSHPKTRKIPRTARMAVIGTWTTLGAYAARHLTDGLIAADDVLDEGGTRAHAKALVDAGLWHPPGEGCGHPTTECPGAPPEGHYQFHDWHVYQPSRDQVLAERAAAAERQKRARERAKAKREAERNGHRHEVSHATSHDVSHDVSHAISHGVTAPVSHGPPDPTRPEGSWSGRVPSSPRVVVPFKNRGDQVQDRHSSDARDGDGLDLDSTSDDEQAAR